MHIYRDRQIEKDVIYVEVVETKFILINLHCKHEDDLECDSICVL